MAIDLATGFNIGSKDAIDERQVLTLEQMKNLDESIYPDNYFAICKDNGKLYLYDVNNPVDAETGKFRKVSSNESVDPSIFQKINDDTLITEDKTVVGAINELKTGVSSISVPTQVSQLINDSGYITSDEVDLIKEYNPDETYNEGQICLYNNYVWLCKTVTTGAFEESNWEKQTDNITELDLDTIKTFLGLTPEQLDIMANLISSEIRTDKVFSSSETYTRINESLKEAKQYCITQLSQKSTGSFKIVTSVAEVTDGNYLYLIMNDDTSKYDIYALVDGNVEKLTTIEVNLDNYFTKSEIEADYLKKEYADDKYATITTLTTHTGDANIHVTTTDKAKWDKVTDKLDVADFNTHKDNTDIHITSAERTKLNKIDEKANVSDIPIKVKEAVNTEVAHIKRFNSVPKNDWNNAIEEGYYSIQNDDDANAIKNRPYQYAIQMRVIRADTNDINYAYQIAYVSSEDTSIYIRRQKRDGTWLPWGKVCITNVINVGVTTITPVNSAITGTIEYTVKNGICYVSFKNVKSTTNTDDLSISTTMPKSSINCGFPLIAKGSKGNIGFIYIDENTTKLNGNFWIADLSGSCSFSYPVAE